MLDTYKLLKKGKLGANLVTQACGWFGERAGRAMTERDPRQTAGQDLGNAVANSNTKRFTCYFHVLSNDVAQNLGLVTSFDLHAMCGQAVRLFF